MRSDMHKVVCERPRHTPDWNGRFPRGQKREIPQFEGMGRPHERTKWAVDLVGPMRRWLRSRTGRLWDDAYSEASKVIQHGGGARKRLKACMLGLVQRHTFMRDGRVWCFPGGYQPLPAPVEEACSPSAPFYVHPVTRLLCQIPDVPWRNLKKQSDDARARTRKWLNKTTLLKQINGSWFRCTIEPFPERFAKGENPLQFDLGERKQISRSQARNLYGETVRCTAKRQLSHAELKRHGLANVTPILPSPRVVRPRVCATPGRAPLGLGNLNSNHASSGMIT